MAASVVSKAIGHGEVIKYHSTPLTPASERGWLGPKCLPQGHTTTNGNLDPSIIA